MAKRKKRKRPVRHLDLNVAADRKAAWRDLTWGDHGFLRAGFRNLHAISPEMWRSNQPGPRQIAAHARERGIRTIINLRGESPKGYYLLEREAAEAQGIRLVDFQVFSRDTPSKETILAAKALFEAIEYPALMHCKSGADRAGLMAVLYAHFRLGQPIARAVEQLSFRYLHVRQGKTGILDAVFAAYIAFDARTPTSFEDWVRDHYDPAALKSAFLASRAGKINFDEVIGRE